MAPERILLGERTTRTDSLGTTSYMYNNQGLLKTVSNAFGQVQSTTYDANDRPTTVVDANGVTVTQTFDWFGRLLTRTYPDTGVETFVHSARGLTSHTDQLNKTTTYAYDQALRKTSEITPNNETILFTYNAAGDLLTLVDGKNQTTKWDYDIEGRVWKKYYTDNLASAKLTYTYDSNSRLVTRLSAAKGTTSYTYDAAGNVTLVNYPSTSDIVFTYDALNRVSTMSNSFGLTSYTYTAGGNLLTEDGPWLNDTVTYGYHASVPKLRTSLSLLQPSNPVTSWVQTYAHDAARRLQTVTSPGAGGAAQTFTYGYAVGQNTSPAPIVRKVTFPNTSFIDYGYDNVARMTSTILKKNDSTVLNSHSYLYDLRNARTRQTRTDASYVNYTYDNLGQLDTAIGTGGQSTENLNYDYDAAWNMTARSTATYTVNNLNQVTGDGANTYTYDANGNRTYKSYSGGYVEYFYDDENQLIRVQDTTNPYPSYWWKSEFVYDGRMRMRIRKEYSWDTLYSQWSLSSETRYIYDGMRVIQERNSSNTPAVSYTRGLDLSLSLEGAGGIGGLLARSSGFSGSTGNWSTHVFYHADGNGNVTYLVKSDQTMGAQYRYDPFGRTTSITGTFAGANVYRFSSKEWHSQTGLYYYGYRFYDPNLQRWVNRDPLGERGFEVIRFGICEQNRRFAEMLPRGRNLYSFVRNNSVSHTDAFGLKLTEQDCEDFKADCFRDIAQLVRGAAKGGAGKGACTAGVALATGKKFGATAGKTVGGAGSLWTLIGLGQNMGEAMDRKDLCKRMYTRCLESLGLL